jgi:oligopeptide transport system substrate-binding protein
MTLIKNTLTLALVGMLAFTGCSKKESRVEIGNRDGILHVGNGSEPPTLDPGAITDFVSFRIVEALWEPLVDYDPVTNRMVPAAAERYEMTEDGLHYTFYIRDGAKWSNGDPLTAHDFEFGIRRYLEPAMAGPYTEFFKGIKNAVAYSRGETIEATGERLITWEDVGVKALDDQRLRFEMEHPNLALLVFLRSQYFYPIHQPSISAFGEIDETKNSPYFRPGTLVTNGAFKLTSWEPNKVVVIAKNEHYWEADAVRLNEIHYYPIDNNETEYNSFRAGQLHRTATVPSSKMQLVRNSGNPAVRTAPFFGTYYYEFNVEKEPFNDPRVRRALAYAIDREQIVEFIAQGGQEVAHSFIPPTVNGYEPKFQFKPNLEAARRLLAEAGYPGGEGFPRVEVTFNTSEGHRAIAEAIQQMWATELGIEITLANQEWKVFLETRQQGNYQIARAAWVGGLDFSGYLDIFETNSGNNNSNYSSPEFDRLVSQGAREADPRKRMEYFQQAEQVLLRDMPVAPIYHYTTTQLIHPAVKNWHDSPVDYRPWKYVYLDPSVEFDARGL